MRWLIETEVFEEIWDGAPAQDKLLGYPSVSSLAYDPTPGPEWVPLITLWSHEDLGWCWNDGDFLFVFVEGARLTALDFSTLRSDAG